MITIPQTQNALFLSSKGGDYVVDSREVYKPGDGEILVKVHSVGLNPSEWKIQRYDAAGSMVDVYPWAAGWDGSGEVVDVGTGELDGYGIGDRVAFQNVEFKTRYGTFQQYVIVRVWTGAICKIPENISFDEAATLPLVLSTAYGALTHPKPWGFGVGGNGVNEKGVDVKGQPLVVLGGASGVGQMVIQLASHIGFSPIITTASSKHTSYLESLGASHIIDRNLTKEDIQTKVKSIVGEIEVQYVYDTVGEETTKELGLLLLSSESELVGTRTSNNAQRQLGTVDPFIATPVDDIESKIRINAFFAVHMEAPGSADNLPMFKDLFGKLNNGWLEKGIVKPLRCEVLQGGLAGIISGIARLERGEISGIKLIGKPSNN